MTVMTDHGTAIAAMRAAVGDRGLLIEPDQTRKYLTDWTGEFSGKALAVVRPASTEEVSRVVCICVDAGIAITAQGGNTGIAGGGVPFGNRPHILLSLERMRSIRAIDTVGRIATVDAGIVLQSLQEAVAEHGLIFPLMFGARGTCTIGGNLSTNAGGSNVLRYGNTRALCLGIEAVLADGGVISDISGVRKDNTGYDLRDLLIGAEGTLGIITGATLRLFPAPRVTATAFLSVRDVPAALEILNRLQDASGGLVEAFEYMPAPLVDLACVKIGARPPLQSPAVTGILVELASTRPGDTATDDNGTTQLEAVLLGALEELMEDGLIEDAVVASSGQQRANLWEMRESVGEALFALDHCYMFDIALPLAQVPDFLDVTDAEARNLGFRPLTVGHLGDGNLHYTVSNAEGNSWADLPLEAFKSATLDRVREVGGSFSAEHGIGRGKLALMTRYRSPERLRAMRKIKDALDPRDIFNPGKTIPAA